MNMHHYHMKKLSQTMQDWTYQNLAHLGIFECTDNGLNIKKKAFVPIPMNYSWYCEYMEKGFDTKIAHRLNSSINIWNKSTQLFNDYKNSISSTDFYKMDLIKKTSEGYEVLIIAGNRKLNINELKALQQCFAQVRLFAEEIKQKTPHVLTDLRPYKQVQLKYHGLDTRCFENYLKI